MIEFQKLLDNIVLFVNEVRRDEPDMGNVQDYSREIASNYYQIQENSDCICLLDEEFSEDKELYILILSVLFFLFGEERHLAKVEELLFQGEFSFERIRSLATQIRTNRFSKGLTSVPYDRERKLQRYLAEQMEKEFCFYNIAYIPYEERDHNLIILETDTLLADLHAPTRIILEIYTTLRYKFGYDVLLLVDVETLDKEFDNVWVNAYRTNYAEGYKGFCQRIYQGKEVLLYQQCINSENQEEVKSLLANIMGWKPEFIWHIGSSSVMAEQFRKITTLVSMPCSDGYAISDAQVMVSYMQNDKERVSNMQEYINSCNQKMIDIQFALPYEETGKKYSLAELGIPSDAFVISLVGNRLEEEINKEFIRIMQQVLEENEKVYFLLVGEHKRSWNTKELQQRVISYGFCTELKDLLKETHLFMNPKRKGGGGGAACSIAVGVPVLTLGDCDVANVGNSFICESLEKYPEMVQRYCTDKSFYESQCEECKRSAERLFKVDNDAAFHQVVLQVQEWLQTGQL